MPKPEDPSGKIGVEGTQVRPPVPTVTVVTPIQAQIDKVQSLMEGILGMKVP